MKSSKRIPTNDLFARLGYYALPIQKVVKRWPAIPRGRMQRYFGAVAAAVKGGTRLEINAWPHEWRCIFELGLAISKVMTDKTRPEYWLLTLPVGVATDCRFDTWFELIDKIVSCGGPRFTDTTIRKAASRLRLCGSLDFTKARNLH